MNRHRDIYMYSSIRLRLTTHSITIKYKWQSILLKNVNNLDMFITLLRFLEPVFYPISISSTSCGRTTPMRWYTELTQQFKSSMSVNSYNNARLYSINSPNRIYLNKLISKHRSNTTAIETGCERMRYRQHSLPPASHTPLHEWCICAEQAPSQMRFGYSR